MIEKKITLHDSISITKYLSEVNKIPLLTQEREEHLGYRILDNDEAAIDEMIRSNLRIVVTLAKPYVNTKIKLEDLINEGNFGLIHSARTYDVTLGFKFISYARKQVLMFIQNYVNEEAHSIRIPHGKLKALRKINKFTNEFEFRHCRKPSLSEIIKHFNGDDKMSESIIRGAYKTKTNIVVSMNEPVGDGESTLGNYVPGTFPETSHLVETGSDVIALTKILSSLTEKERLIVTHLNGLFGNEVLKIEQLSRKINLSKARIQQIHSRTLLKLTEQAKQKRFSSVFV